MEEGVFFYSLITSPYLTHAAFIVQTKEGKALAIVTIRNQEGEFVSGVRVRDLGGVISKDYIPVGYNFGGVKPIFLYSCN